MDNPATILYIDVYIRYVQMHIAQCTAVSDPYIYKLHMTHI